MHGTGSGVASLESSQRDLLRPINDTETEGRPREERHAIVWFFHGPNIRHGRLSTWDLLHPQGPEDKTKQLQELLPLLRDRPLRLRLMRKGSDCALASICINYYIWGLQRSMSQNGVGFGLLPETRVCPARLNGDRDNDFRDNLDSRVV